MVAAHSAATGRFGSYRSGNRIATLWYMAPSIHGRDGDLAVLMTALRGAREGTGSGLVLSAEPGMGGTTMLAAVRAAAGDLRVLEAEGVEAEASCPLAALNRLLRPLSGFVVALDPCHADALAPVFGAGTGHDAFALGKAVHRLLAEAARTAPVLVLVDDAHLIDGASAGALAFTARRLVDEPVLLVLSTAAQDGDPFAAIPRLVLGPLSAEASRRLLADRVANGVPDELAEDLLELAGGNPLALVELAEALTAEQLAGDAAAPDRLPWGSRLRAGLRRRFERLSPDARRLCVLAVVDEQLDVDTVVRAAGDAGIDLAALDEAIALGLVRLDGERVEPPNPLVRGTLLADIPLADRQVAHRLLVGALDPEQQRLRWTTHRVAIADGAAAPARRRAGGGRVRCAVER